MPDSVITRQWNGCTAGACHEHGAAAEKAMVEIVALVTDKLPRQRSSMPSCMEVAIAPQLLELPAIGMTFSHKGQSLEAKPLEGTRPRDAVESVFFKRPVSHRQHPTLELLSLPE